MIGEDVCSFLVFQIRQISPGGSASLRFDGVFGHLFAVQCALTLTASGALAVGDFITGVDGKSTQVCHPTTE
jgi:hypothetical protein